MRLVCWDDDREWTLNSLIGASYRNIEYNLLLAWTSVRKMHLILKGLDKINLSNNPYLLSIMSLHLYYANHPLLSQPSNKKNYLIKEEVFDRIVLNFDEMCNEKLSRDLLRKLKELL